MLPSATLFNNVFTSSDHCQCFLNIKLASHSKVPPFRFEKMLCLRKDFEVLVKKTWCIRVNSSFMFCFVQKCKI